MKVASLTSSSALRHCSSSSILCNSHLKIRLQQRIRAQSPALRSPSLQPLRVLRRSDDVTKLPEYGWWDGDQIEALPSKSKDVNPAVTWWASIPARTKLVVACSSSFVLSNLDKVNMTVAIIPIAQELGWSSTVSGLVQSSFFWGFLLAQLPGGYLSSKVGGHRTLPPSVALWSFATTLLPFATSSMPMLCMSRSVVGLGEAVAPSAIVDIIARTIPKENRAGAVSTAFSGLHVGSVVGLMVSPAIIDMWGWRALFAAYGVLGFAWCIGFRAVLEDVCRQDPELRPLLPGIMPDQTEAEINSTNQADAATLHIPYRAMLRSEPVQALMFTHFAHSWFNFTMLAWLPTYFTDTLSVDLIHAAQTALLPPLAGIAAATMAGKMADKLIATGVPLPVVRKISQCTAFLVPASLLTLLSLSVDPSISTSLSASGDAEIVSAIPNANFTIGCITMALGASSFSLAGLYCTHQDLSPKYASAMLGLTNTAAAVPGIVGIALVGFLLDQTEGSWELALFAPSAMLLAAGAAVYTLKCRNDPVDFDGQDDSPFGWEARLGPVRRVWGKLRAAAGLISPR